MFPKLLMNYRLVLMIDFAGMNMLLILLQLKGLRIEKKKERVAPKFIFPMTFKNKGIDATKTE